MPHVEMYANEYSSTLNGAITAGASSLVVASATGAPATVPFRIRVSGPLTGGGSGTEYMQVTAVSGTTWTVTRAVEAPFNVALGFATGATVKQVLTTIGMFEAAPFVNVKSPRFAGGARGDDATDDSAAIQAALNYAATLGSSVVANMTGATVYFPPGVYRVGTAIQVPSRVRILGSSRVATTIRRTANINVFQFYGTAPADSVENARNIYCALEHMNFEGGDFNASLLDFVYCSQFQLDHVRAFGCGGSVLDLTEVWDSNFSNLFTDWCGSGTNPTIWIRNARAANPAFGWSSDSSNQLKFYALHCETFSGTAIRIEPGTSNSAPPNGIYFNVLKCESAQVTSGFPYIYIDQACQSIHFDKVYCSLNNFAAGSSTGINVIENNSAGQVSLKEIEIASANVTPTLVNSGIRNNTTGADAYTTIDGLVGILGRPPTTALVNVVSAGGLEIDHVDTNNGTLISGFQMEVQQRMLALTSNATIAATSIADISGFSFTNVLPGTYTLEFRGSYTNAGASYPRFAFGGTATFTTPIEGQVTVNTSASASVTGRVTAANTVHTGTATSGAVTGLPCSGWFSFTVTATGTVTLRWAASAAVTQTLLAGTWAILSRNR